MRFACHVHMYMYTYMCEYARYTYKTISTPRTCRNRYLGRHLSIFILFQDCTLSFPRWPKFLRYHARPLSIYPSFPLSLVFQTINFTFLPCFSKYAILYAHRIFLTSRVPCVACFIFLQKNFRFSRFFKCGLFSETFVTLIF